MQQDSFFHFNQLFQPSLIIIKILFLPSSSPLLPPLPPSPPPFPPPSPSYTGPHPSPTNTPLTDMAAEEALFAPGSLPLPFVMASIAQFKDQKLIHKRYTTRLLISLKRYFQSQPSLTELTVPSVGPDGTKESAHVTVCGDTHGQFYDVLHIFETNGYPSASNPYLFNGDFVDRGSFGVEVVLTYFLFKLADPDAVFLARGNHETKNMNKIYGFEGEVKHKYDANVFSLFLEVFQQLPLATTINGKVFVTHGGLSSEEGVTLDDVRKVKRGCEVRRGGDFIYYYHKFPFTVLNLLLLLFSILSSLLLSSLLLSSLLLSSPPLSLSSLPSPASSATSSGPIPSPSPASLPPKEASAIASVPTSPPGSWRTTTSTSSSGATRSRTRATSSSTPASASPSSPPPTTATP